MKTTDIRWSFEIYSFEYRRDRFQNIHGYGRADNQRSAEMIRCVKPSVRNFLQISD
jgi:hypothetical protein